MSVGKCPTKVGKIPTKLEKFQPVSNQCPTEIEKEINIDIETEVEEENRKLSSATKKYKRSSNYTCKE